MSQLVNILPLENILIAADLTSKKRAFEEAGLLFEQLYNLDRFKVTESLFARERLGSTGLNYGVAIPHGRLKDLTAPMAAIFTLKNPIGFDAPDELPVNLLFFLLIPENANQQHLEILTEIAQLLNNAAVRESLKAVQSAEELLKLITDWRPQLAT